MVALILAAGYGTRLYPLAEKTPKALLPIQGKPILEYLIERIESPSVGVREILLVSNHRFLEEFRQWLAGTSLKAPCTLLDDGSTSDQNRLGSMGDLAFAIRTRGIEEDLLVLGSDNLFKDPLTGFLSFARGKSPHVTLGAYEMPQRTLASRYGVLGVDGEGRILQFSEKPKEPPSALVSTAVYFFPRETVNRVLQYVESVSSTDTLGSFIHWLISRERVFAYRFQGPWFDIGDFASYQQAEESFLP